MCVSFEKVKRSLKRSCPFGDFGHGVKHNEIDAFQPNASQTSPIWYGLFGDFPQTLPIWHGPFEDFPRTPQF